MRKAFSLFELIIVVIVISIIATFIIQKSNDSITLTNKMKIKSEIALIRNAISKQKASNTLLSNNDSIVLDTASINVEHSELFKNILDFTYTWKATSEDDRYFEGRNRNTGELKFKGTRADLIFGSNTELRAIAEVYGASDGQDRFVKDFVAAWTKVMNLDRFDVK